MIKTQKFTTIEEARFALKEKIERFFYWACEYHENKILEWDIHGEMNDYKSIRKMLNRLLNFVECAQAFTYKVVGNYSGNSRSTTRFSELETEAISNFCTKLHEFPSGCFR